MFIHTIPIPHVPLLPTPRVVCFLRNSLARAKGRRLAFSLCVWACVCVCAWCVWCVSLIALFGFLQVSVYILQRGVQWKQGVVICVVLYTSLLYNATQIHCTPLSLHPPVMNIQSGTIPADSGQAHYALRPVRLLRVWISKGLTQANS